MSKILVEKPRRNSYPRKLRGRKTETDQINNFSKDPEKYDETSLPKKISPLRHRGEQLNWDLKEFNENLKPLMRYLESQVGRPWSKIYSEIRKHISSSSTVQQHLLDHMMHWIAFKPSDVDIKYKEFKIDPQGLLQKSHVFKGKKYFKKLREKEEEKNRTRIPYSSKGEYHKINGVWYDITYTDWYEKIVQYKDPKNPYSKEKREKFRDIFRKRQLDTDELKSLKLKND